MKISQLVKELNHILDTKGDLCINISCVKPEIETEIGKRQKYLISEPNFIVIENYETPNGKGRREEVSLRDWPY